MKILMIYPGMVQDLPPILTSAMILSDLGASVKVVCAGCARETADALRIHNVELVQLSLQRYPASVAGKIYLRFKFHYLLCNALADYHPDVVWFHGVHAMGYHDSRKFPKAIVVAHAHELYDKLRHVRKQNIVLKNASFFIVPES